VVVTSIIRPASNQSIREWVARLHGEPWELLTSSGGRCWKKPSGHGFSGAAQPVCHGYAGFDAAEADTSAGGEQEAQGKKLRDFYSRFEKEQRARGERGKDRGGVEDDDGI